MLTIVHVDHVHTITDDSLYMCMCVHVLLQCLYCVSLFFVIPCEINSPVIILSTVFRVSLIQSILQFVSLCL